MTYPCSELLPTTIIDDLTNVETFATLHTGVGLRAKRAFAAGESIAAETPAATSRGQTNVPLERCNDRYAWSMVRRLLTRNPDVAVAILNDPSPYATGVGAKTSREWEAEDDRVLSAIAEEHGNEWTEERIAALYDVIGTNNLTCQVHVMPIVASMQTDDGFVACVIPWRMGFFSTFSRINHSCEPNAYLRHSNDSGLPSELVAMRSVAAGDELCIGYASSYTDATPPSREVLHRTFGFHCRCQRCYAL